MENFNSGEWFILTLKMVVIIPIAIILYEDGLNKNKEVYDSRFQQVLMFLKSPVAAIGLAAILLGLIGVLEDFTLIVAIAPIYIYCYCRGLYKNKSTAPTPKTDVN